MLNLLIGREIDDRLRWPPGRADRLAKRGKLPHIKLPDGSLRYEWPQIEPLVIHVPSDAQSEVAT